MPHVRSVSIGVWLTRGSRHEPRVHEGIAHFVEHMLFKGTDTRSAEDLAQQIDSIGGHLDAFTSKEYAGYFIKVLDEHLPLAVDVLSDLVTSPAFDSAEIEREKKVVLEEIKMVEDTPDDLVHEIFAGAMWPAHPLGRPILGEPDTVSALDRDALRRYFQDAYVAPNFIVAAVGNLEHDRVRDLVSAAFVRAGVSTAAVEETAPAPAFEVIVRSKDLEQSHVCLGGPGLSHGDSDRYVAYALNTMLGGSMSSRLFQNVREKRGLAYSVFSSLSTYRDTGAVTIYAGCANDSVRELVEVVMAEVRRFKADPLVPGELQRAKDHLKGSLMLGLESTSSRMTHLARQEIYGDTGESLDDMLTAIDVVSDADIARVAQRLLPAGPLSLTVLGGGAPTSFAAAQLALA
ncbi:MAG: insulinase family protein [Acidobacteria bacterium]|nr:insulinase family protein [Acidobacteriota bacterium]